MTLSGTHCSRYILSGRGHPLPACRKQHRVRKVLMVQKRMYTENGENYKISSLKSVLKILVVVQFRNERRQVNKKCYEF